MRSKSTTRKSVSRPKRSAHAHGRSQRLRESAEQFRLAQDALGIVTWIWDIATDRVQWHGDAARMLGLPPRGFSGRYQDYLKLLHPDDAASSRAVLIECMKGERPEYRTTERVIWPDGSIHWLETYGRADYGPDGRAARMSGVVKDISERKRQESAREKAEKQLARVFDASPDYIVIVRAGDGEFVAANPAFEKATGYRADEIVGRRVGELNLWGIPGERERFLADLQKQGSLQNRPVLLRARDGGIVSGRMSATLIDHGGERLIISMMHDVTGVRQLERRARQSESKFAALFATGPAGLIVTLPRERKVLEINDVALKILGLTREEAVGARTTELAKVLNIEDIEALRQRALAGERGISDYFRLERRDGRRIEVLASAALVELDGEPHFILSLLDVTEQRRVEQKQREADARYRALFETSLDGMVIGTPDNVVVDANPAACAMTGYSLEELAGKNVAQLFHPEDLATQPLRRDLGRKWSVIERRLARKDGAELHVEIVAGPMPGGNVLAMMRDITERKRADSALRESEARFRALTDLSADWYWEQDENFRFVWQEGEAARPDGNRPPRYIGMTRWEAHKDSLTPEQWAAHRAKLEAHQSFRDLEFPRMSNDGVVRWVSVSGYPIFDDKGKLRGYRGVGHDITERKRNETLLINIAHGVSAEIGGAFFRSLAEHLARELGADFAFIGELTGPDNSSMRTLAQLVDGAIVEQPDYPVAGSMGERALKEGRTVVYSRGVCDEFRDARGIMQRHGVEAYIGTPLYGADGKPLGVLAVAHRKPVDRGRFWASMIEIFGARAAAEIERSRAEALVRETNESLEQIVQERTAQLKEANRELESYSYSISHDLRQPLNAIGGFAELLREQVAGQLSSAAQEFVGEIEGNATRMEQMIESLMQLSRAGRSALSKAQVDARQVVDSVLHDLSANGPLKAEVRVGELPSAAGDPVLLRQVWVNLIGNALKYSSRSSAPRVEIGGTRRQGMVEYSVRDNGVGFDMQQAERLFSAFQRLPSSAGFAGSGIGLAIVERIVRRHGGAIHAESVPGKGATFRFTLPDNPLT